MKTTALLSRDAVAGILATLRESVPHDECWTCDCFQGYLTQMSLDAGPAASDLLAPLKVPRRQMHGCLGCDPCPPAAAYSDYLLARQFRSSCGCSHCGGG